LQFLAQAIINQFQKLQVVMTSNINLCYNQPVLETNKLYQRYCNLEFFRMCDKIVNTIVVYTSYVSTLFRKRTESKKSILSRVSCSHGEFILKSHQQAQGCMQAPSSVRPMTLWYLVAWVLEGVLCYLCLVTLDYAKT